MFFSLQSMVSGLALLAMSVSASPVPAAVPEGTAALEKRVAGGVYMCTAINWGGTCIKFNYNLGQCYSVTEALKYQTSSLGPDPNTLCQVYYDYNCQDAGSTVQQLNGVFINPGSADLRTVNWNDAIGSIKCEWFER